MMATDNTPKQRRKEPEERRTCVIHVRLTPAERERLGEHSERLRCSMAWILAKGGLEAAEQMESPENLQERNETRFTPRPLTVTEQINMDVRRKIREEKQAEEREW